MCIRDRDRMLAFKIALIGIAGAMLAMVTKQFKPEYSTLVLLAVCLFLIGYLTSNLKEVLNFVQTLQKRIPISSMYIKMCIRDSSGDTPVPIPNTMVKT